MIGVYCFSGSGHGAAIAEWFAAQCCAKVLPITGTENGDVQTAVVVFPVYCQNIPAVVTAFLKQLQAKRAVLIAAYGKISHGNVLWEAARHTNATVIAAAYVPTGHTYLREGTAFDTVPLMPLLDRIASPCAATLKKESKVFWANILPAWRSRVGIAVTRTDACDHCGLCEAQCPMRAIRDGRIGGRCIRCMRCAVNCPRKALAWHVRPVLKRYLEQKRHDAFVIYL